MKQKKNVLATNTHHCCHKNGKNNLLPAISKIEKETLLLVIDIILLTTDSFSFTALSSFPKKRRLWLANKNIYILPLPTSRKHSCYWTGNFSTIHVMWNTTHICFRLIKQACIYKNTVLSFIKCQSCLSGGEGAHNSLQNSSTNVQIGSQGGWVYWCKQRERERGWHCKTRAETEQ